MNIFRVSLLAAVFLATVSQPFRAFTAPVVFNLDPARSSITLSGSVVGNAFKEQGPGSLTTSFSGTIAADVTGGSTIQFIGGSAIDALTSGNWQPTTNGAAGSTPADYGGTAGNFLATAFAAARNVLVDVFSGPLPITSGSFDSSRLTFGFPTNATSVLDYRVTGLVSTSGSKALIGLSTNRITTAATLTTTAAGETITLPVDADFFLSLLSNNDTILNLKGQLVATHSGIQAPIFNFIVVSNQIVTLQWQTIPGQKYQLESSIDLNAWIIEATNLIAAINTVTWSTNVAHSLQFFRVSY